jgi:hypothetical protein
LAASVRFYANTVLFYPLAGDAESYLIAGPKLLGGIRAEEGLPRLDLVEWTTEFPTAGFHLDLPDRRLEFWTARDAPGISARVARAWSGWETRWERDRFESQLERTEGLLTFPMMGRQALLGYWRDALLRDDATDPVEAVRMLVESDRAQGKEVQVNPWALRDDRLELSREERKTILDEVISRL